MKNLFKTMFVAASLMSATSAMATLAEYEFGYTDGSYSTRLGLGDNMKSDTHYDLGMYIGKDCAGKKLLKLKLQAPANALGVENYKIWATPDTVVGEIDTPNSAEFTVGKDDWVTVAFPEPIIIPEDGIYVGYSFDVTLANANKNNGYLRYPMILGNPTGIPGSTWVQINSKGEWWDYNNMGCAMIYAILEGDFPDNNVTINGMTSNSVVKAGEGFKLTFSLTNGGAQKVESWELSYTIDGGEPVTGGGALQFDFPGVGATRNVQFAFPAIAEPGNYQLTFNIDKINGMANTSDKNSITVTVSVAKWLADKRVLMEEATGTWCGWCTRGWIGMREMNKLHKKDFVAAAYHNGDPMDVTKSYPFDFGGGFPGCALDRKLNAIDPFYGTNYGVEFGIEKDYTELLKDPGVANLEVASTFNADKSSLDVTATATFGVAPAGQYTLGYLLLQNGINKPDNDDFYQNNYYYAQDVDKSSILYELVGWGVKKTQSNGAVYGLIEDITYDDVVLNCEHAQGVENSLPAALELDKPYTHNVSFKSKDIYGIGYKGEDNNLANPDYGMEVVVMLIAPNGEIANVRKCPAGFDSVGINPIVAGEEEVNAPVEYYNIQGQRVANPVNGNLYIQRQGNKATKVIL